MTDRGTNCVVPCFVPRQACMVFAEAGLVSQTIHLKGGGSSVRGTRNRLGWNERMG